VPKGDIRVAAKAPLFDHLVGKRQQLDEVAPFQLIESHSVPCQSGPDRRISVGSSVPQAVIHYSHSRRTPSKPDMPVNVPSI
jgi:hypothetical protein